MAVQGSIRRQEGRAHALLIGCAPLKATNPVRHVSGAWRARLLNRVERPPAIRGPRTASGPTTPNPLGRRLHSKPRRDLRDQGVAVGEAGRVRAVAPVLRKRLEAGRRTEALTPDKIGFVSHQRGGERQGRSRAEASVAAPAAHGAARAAGLSLPVPIASPVSLRFSPVLRGYVQSISGFSKTDQDLIVSPVGLVWQNRVQITCETRGKQALNKSQTSAEHVSIRS
jgi:hypothetical protein